MSIDLNTFLIVLTMIAGLYMAWNIGANDVANAMGTSVGSGALKLKQAILVAACLEFSGAFFFGSHVSATLQNGIVNAEIFAPNPLSLAYGMLSALIATGVWLQIASYFGWPVSTTHAIVGGVIGFGAIIGGLDAIQWDHVIIIVFSWMLSPLFGGILAFMIFSILRQRILYTTNPVAQAKKLAPLLVFAVITILSLGLLDKRLNQIQGSTGQFSSVALSCAIGIFAAGISWICVRRIQDVTIKQQKHPYSSEIYTEFEKAKKHLQQAQMIIRNEKQEEVTTLISDIDQLARSLQQPEDIHTISLEYTLVERIFGYLQIISACLMAFAHGANDVANAIGPLSAAINVLQTGTINPFAPVPTWALGLGGVGIVIGLATWGWRVIATIGKKITELTPTRGFAAEFGAAATIFIASRLGLPISTTHTLVGAVIGVGLARGLKALDLTTMRDIVISWVVTIPLSAAFTVSVFYCIRALFG